MTETANTSEMLGNFYHTTQCNNTEDSHLQKLKKGLHAIHHICHPTTRNIRRPWDKKNDNIKMELREIGCKDMNWMGRHRTSSDS
jgi:hypothetical protein